MARHALPSYSKNKNNCHYVRGQPASQPARQNGGRTGLVQKRTAGERQVVQKRTVMRERERNENGESRTGTGLVQKRTVENGNGTRTVESRTGTGLERD